VRRSLLVAIGTLAFLALSAAMALVVLTTSLRHSTDDLKATFQSVNLTRELELALLTHGRLGDGDAVVRAGLEAELWRTFDAARKSIGTTQEAALLAEAQEKIAQYLRRAAASASMDAPGPGAGVELAAAFASLENLVQSNVAQARQAQARAARWDRIADLLGYSISALLVLGVLIVVVWLRTSVLQPLLRLRAAIRDFASGDRSVRAAEAGPVELREVAEQFNTMASALARQQEAWLAFIGGVAHDVRNPLAAMSAATSTLAAPDRPLPPEPRVRNTAALLRRQIERLDRMVGDLLDAARIEAGHLELRVEPRDARDVARETFELFRSSSPRHELVLVLPDDPVPVCCDPLRMEQVLNNLVSNAIKYSPRGGRVEIAVERAERDAVFRVSDGGVGIAPEDMEGIFEPFRRARVARENAPGVGLGLSVARRIAEGHGGRIEIESRLGVGTMVRARIPLLASEPDALPTGGACPPARASGQEKHPPSPPTPNAASAGAPASPAQVDFPITEGAPS
jgi:two-component system, OmpR family, sensor histidine kinase MtrB